MDQLLYRVTRDRLQEEYNNSERGTLFTYASGTIALGRGTQIRTRFVVNHYQYF